MNQLTDSHQRTIDYLRISITDHCNLRCSYCAPFSGRGKLPMADILTYEEIYAIVQAAVSTGVSKIRLTGGEPLIRKDMIPFCRSIAEMPELTDLALTTNGVLLEQMAPQLQQAGVRRVNVSLDTLSPQRYAQITGKDFLQQVLRGIQKAVDVGLAPIKINMVPLRGINDDEIAAMARLTLTAPYDVRYIELMPTNGWSREQHDRCFMSIDTIREQVETVGPLQMLSRSEIDTRGPAQYGRLPGAKGRIGFIAALSHHFCGTCNRLRLTADGKLRACLFSEKETDIKTPLRQGADRSQLAAIIRQTVAAKPERHRLDQERCNHRDGRAMRAIGG